MTPDARNIEWRRSWRDGHLKRICGFANGEGGVLEIGRSRRGEVAGVTEVLRLLEEIPNRARALLGIQIEVKLKAESGREYLEIAVEPHRHPISYKGEFHCYDGRTRRVLTGTALEQFQRRRFGRTWDDVPWPDVRLSDLDEQAIDRFRKWAVKCERLAPEALGEPVDSLIMDLGLREGAHLKRAAGLLFHPSPHRFLLGAHVKIGYFRGTELLFHDVVEGDLFTQASRTMDLLYSKYTRGLISYDGIYRVETFPVSRRAMREAVVNAIVHRDYTRPSAIQIHVYDDQIAIRNSACPTPEWAADRPAEMMPSRPHNPRIADAFFRAGMIEAWGQGIREIVDACLEAGNPRPTWTLESGGNALCATFPFSAAYQAADAVARGIAVPGTGRQAEGTGALASAPEYSQKRTMNGPAGNDARVSLADRPFDAALCSGATLGDLNVEAMYRFIRIARRMRRFPLPEETLPADLLRHLNLLTRGRLTNAAVLLFGVAPQRFLIASEVKCAHFHGTQVAKPIPSYQVYKGTVFQLVDQAVDFVMSKVDLSVGTRAESVQAPVAYEIPQEVVTEAIVNAVAHRDYTDNSSVQVMLFSDRLEVMNSGRLPPPLTVEKLRTAHQSLPANPLIAESMYLLRYIEKMGTGTVDMIQRCVEAGLPEPEFEAGAGFTTRMWRRAETKPGMRRTTQEAAETTQEAGRTTQETGKTTQEIGGTTQEAGSTTQEIGSAQNTRDRILALLRSDPTMTRVALASRVGITPDGVKYHLDAARKAGLIRRVGPTKKGRWQGSCSTPASRTRRVGPTKKGRWQVLQPGADPP